MTDWNGKSALVTGAGTGIGRAVSRELARRGAVVYVTSIVAEEVQALVDAVTAEGLRAIGIVLDVTDDQQLSAALQRVADEQGSLDLVVNNAGLIYVGEYHDMNEAFMRRLIDVNLTAVAMGTLYAYRIMKEQGHGLIANVASQGGLMPAGTMALYSATKHGVVGLSASVGGEAEAHGVEIKTICPGNVASELLGRGQTRGTNADAVLQDLPKLISAEEAAVIIVDGLGRRKRKIIFPFYAKVLWFAQRVWPEFGHHGAARLIEQFRQKRNDELDQG